MFYLGQYDLKINDNIIEFPFEMDKDEVEYCEVKTEDGYTYLIVDYIKEVKELDCYKEGKKGIMKIQDDHSILPSELSHYSHIPLVCIGAGDVIEIWEKNQFNDYCDKQRALFESLKEISF